MPTSKYMRIFWEWSSGKTQSGQAMGEAGMPSWRTEESLSVPSWHSPKSLGAPPGAACSGFYLNLAIAMCQLQSHLPFNQKRIFQLVLAPGWAPNASCGCFPKSNPTSKHEDLPLLKTSKSICPRLWREFLITIPKITADSPALGIQRALNSHGAL